MKLKVYNGRAKCMCCQARIELKEVIDSWTCDCGLSQLTKKGNHLELRQGKEVNYLEIPE